MMKNEGPNRRSLLEGEIPPIRIYAQSAELDHTPIIMRGALSVSVKIEGKELAGGWI